MSQSASASRGRSSAGLRGCLRGWRRVPSRLKPPRRIVYDDCPAFAGAPEVCATIVRRDRTPTHPPSREWVKRRACCEASNESTHRPPRRGGSPSGEGRAKAPGGQPERRRGQDDDVDQPRGRRRDGGDARPAARRRPALQHQRLARTWRNTRSASRCWRPASTCRACSRATSSPASTCSAPTRPAAAPTTTSIGSSRC